MMSAPNTTSGRRRRTCVGEGDRVGARMAPLHALEDQVVAMLQREMQMRHQPRLFWRAHRAGPASASTESIEEMRSRSSSGTCLRICSHQLAEPRRARQVRAIARDVDAGEHHLAVAVLGEAAHLRDHLAHRHRARISAAIRDDAEGAAMIAAVLHLHERARAPFDALDQMQRGLAHRHDVVDDGLFPRRRDRRVRATRALRGPEAALSFSSLPSTRSTSGMAAKVCGSVCAAQPVTTMLRVRAARA